MSTSPDSEDIDSSESASPEWQLSENESDYPPLPPTLDIHSHNDNIEDSSEYNSHTLHLSYPSATKLGADNVSDSVGASTFPNRAQTKSLNSITQAVEKRHRRQNAPKTITIDRSRDASEVSKPRSRSTLNNHKGSHVTTTSSRHSSVEGVERAASSKCVSATSTNDDVSYTEEVNSRNRLGQDREVSTSYSESLEQIFQSTKPRIGEKQINVGL
jgi:hypothetical protein